MNLVMRENFYSFYKFRDLSCFQELKIGKVNFLKIKSVKKLETVKHKQYYTQYVILFELVVNRRVGCFKIKWGECTDPPSLELYTPVFW